MHRLGDWQAALTADRRTDPAELGALRVDFAEWLERLSPRDRRVASQLAAGESTSAVARMLRLTAGRISQLRRELHDHWLAFIGDAPPRTA